MFLFDQNSHKKIKKKILNAENRFGGFLLQRDINTTNLLLNCNQFSMKNIKDYLQFRPMSGKKPENPNRSLKILRQNGNISENTENDKKFYLLSTFKPKKLKHKKLKLPLPYMKTIPLYKTFYSYSSSNTKIKCMEDDLNITSKYGKKVVYNMKEKLNIPDLRGSNRCITNSNKLNIAYNNEISLETSINKTDYIIKFNKRAKTKNPIQFDRKKLLKIKQTIHQINNNLKAFQEEEKERKKLLRKNTFFTTELFIDKNENYKEKYNKNHRNIINAFINKGKHRNSKSLFD